MSGVGGLSMLDQPADMRHGVNSAYETAALEIVKTPEVAAALAELGRTEDVRFSPDNKLAALAGYSKNSCLVLCVQFGQNSGRPALFAHDHFELQSPSISDPHGFDFIGNDYLVVANRAGSVTVFKLPAAPYHGQTFNLEPICKIRRTGLFHRLRTPGSLCTLPNENGKTRLLVCNTFGNRVTAHQVNPKSWHGFTSGHILAEKDLEIPDGIAVSPNRSYMAISNHNRHCVSMFQLSEADGFAATPCGTLSGISYPHGLRFSPDGRKLYVADAGEPMIHLFESAEGNWDGEYFPVGSVRVLSQATFLAGRTNEAEGGPKGLDLDITGRFLAVTCEAQPLAVFDIGTLFGI